MFCVRICNFAVKIDTHVGALLESFQKVESGDSKWKIIWSILWKGKKCFVYFFARFIFLILLISFSYQGAVFLWVLMSSEFLRASLWDTWVLVGQGDISAQGEPILSGLFVVITVFWELLFVIIVLQIVWWHRIFM